MDSSTDNKPGKFVSVLQAGILNWPRLFLVVVPVALIAWSPCFIQPLLPRDFLLPSFIWGIIVSLYCFIKYSMVLPVLITEDENIVNSMKKAAHLSEGMRVEILLVIVAVLLFAEGVCLGLSYAFWPVLINTQGTFQLGLLSTLTYFTRWLLYSLMPIAIYAYYRQQRSLYIRSYLVT